MKGSRQNHPPPTAESIAALSAAATASNGASPTTTSPSAKGTAKYTNKDGSKFITVPKAASPVTAISPSVSLAAGVVPPLPPATRPQANENDVMAMEGTPGADGSIGNPAGNRKKAKRRAKAAARERKAEDESDGGAAPTTALPSAAPHRQGQNGVYSITLGENPGNSDRNCIATTTINTTKDDDASVERLSNLPQQAAANGSGESKSKKSKKKKKKKTGDQQQSTYRAPSTHTATASSSKEKIWNTNSHEERQRIKEFWLDLSEDERKSLVKVEKDTVLKKMKEQQKMTCSCHFCGRKRTAIEEELEGLYDSYYEELEQFANDPAGQQQQQQQKQQRASAVLPPSSLSGRFGLHGGHAHGTSRGYPGYAHSHSHGHPPAHSHAHVHGHPHSHAQLHAHHHAQSHPASASSGSHQPSHGRIVEHAGEDDEDEDDELDEEYIDDEEEEELEDEDEEVDDEDEGSEDDDIDEDDVSDDDGEEEIPPEEIHRDYASDFFNFGNSLQVHGGILTVADDLLKNDGRKFIEMMEQLAERRMAREEDAKDQDGGLGGLGGAGGRGAGAGAGVGPYGSAPPLSGAQYSHSHHIPSEEDYGPEDEDDEEYGSEDEEYDEEEDSMTEEQRMEEGRRMFQIFAARMFEQRVLTAYREKVSKERQQRLFDELDEEKIQQQKRDEKRAKDAQKRKDKAAQKKKALADEKARKEAEKEVELAARRAEDARREDEQKRKAEEKRKKREAQRKADEEERLRKEAERQRRINEQKDQERRALEAKERDKKRKEESRQRDKEEQEKRERESRERKEKQERDKRDKEARARANEAKERQRQEERAAQKAQPAAARAAVTVPAVPAMPTVPTVPAVPVVPSVPNAATPANSAIGSTVAASPAPITLAKRPVPNQASQSGHSQPHASSALTQQALQSATATSVSLQQQQKVPTPVRPRQLSQQGIGASNAAGPGNTASHNSSHNASQHASPHPMTPVQSHNTFAAANQSSVGLLGGIFGHPGANGLGSFFPPTSPLNGANRPISSQQPMYNGISGSPTQLPYQLLTNLAPGFGGQLQQPVGTGIGSSNGPLGTRGVAGPQGVMPILSSSSSSSSAINSIGRGGSGGGFGPMTPLPPPGFGGLAGIGSVDSLVTPIGSLQYESVGIAGGQHSRQASGSAFDTGSSPNGNNIMGIGSAQPIARPTPIGRPGSTVNGQRSTFTAIGSPSVDSSALSAEPSSSGTTTDDDLLGSRALLDDSDFAMDGFTSIRRSVFPGRGSNGSVQPPPADLTSPFMSPSSLWAPVPPHHPLTHAHHHQQSSLHTAPGMHQLSHQLPGQVGSQLPHPLAVAGNAFPPPQSAFGPPPGISAPPGMGISGTGSSGWGMSGASGANTGVSGVSGSGIPLAFPPHGGSLGRGTLGRLATLRKLLCQACKDLAAEAVAEGTDGTDTNSLQLLPIDAVKARVFSMASTYAVGPVLDSELDQLYDTEGNSKNGGGIFETKRSGATRDTKTVNGAKEDSLDDGAIVAIRWIPDAQSLLHRFGSGSAGSNGNGTNDSFGSPFGGNHTFGDFGGGGGFGGYNSGPGGISNGLNGLGGLASLGGIGYFNAGDSHGNTAPIGAGSPSSAQR